MDESFVVTVGMSKVIDMAHWLDNQGWPFKLELAEQNPFGSYRITIPDSEQRFMFFMTWGDNNDR